MRGNPAVCLKGKGGVVRKTGVVSLRRGGRRALERNRRLAVSGDSASEQKDVNPITYFYRFYAESASVAERGLRAPGAPRQFAAEPNLFCYYGDNTGGSAGGRRDSCGIPVRRVLQCRLRRCRPSGGCIGRWCSRFAPANGTFGRRLGRIRLNPRDNRKRSAPQ